MKNLPPLGLPHGSVRDLVVLLFSAGLTFGFVTSKVNAAEYLGIVGPILGVHLGGKLVGDAKRGGGDGGG